MNKFNRKTYESWTDSEIKDEIDRLIKKKDHCKNKVNQFPLMIRINMLCNLLMFRSVENYDMDN